MTSTPIKPWQTRNADYPNAVRESFRPQGMMATLGAGISHMAPGEVDLIAPFAPQYGQQNGYWHAGGRLQSARFGEWIRRAHTCAARS